MDLNYFSYSKQEPTVALLDYNRPIVYVSPLAFKKMAHYVDLVDTEIGWMGSVEELESGDYLIDDVFLFEQQVSDVTTEITEDALASFAHEILKRDNGMELMNKIRFWGHSHVNMPTGASGQDNEQMSVFSSCGHDFFIRGIFNKSGSVNISIYDYSRGYVIHNPEWSIYSPEEDALKESIQLEIDEKVSEIIPKRYEHHKFHPSHFPISHVYKDDEYEDTEDDSEMVDDGYEDTEDDSEMVDDFGFGIDQSKYDVYHRVEQSIIPDDPISYPYKRNSLYK